MSVTSRTVHMTVGNFVVRGVSHVDDFYIEIQRNTCKGVISINNDRLESHFSYGDNSSLIRGKAHTDFDLL